MPYSAEISRSNPTCFLFLVDQSSSMLEPFGGQAGKNKSEGVADALNRLHANVSRQIETRISIERLLDHSSDIRIAESEHGAKDARRFRHAPTFILRGLTHIALEFDPVEAPAR